MCLMIMFPVKIFQVLPICLYLNYKWKQRGREVKSANSCREVCLNYGINRPINALCLIHSEPLFEGHSENIRIGYYVGIIIPPQAIFIFQRVTI